MSIMYVAEPKSALMPVYMAEETAENIDVKEKNRNGIISENIRKIYDIRIH